MRAFLFDASAVVKHYHPESPDDRRKLDLILDERLKFQRAGLFVPEFCIVEVFKVFARRRYKEKRWSHDEYLDILKSFREDIHWGRLFYPLPLDRYHVLAADEIMVADYEAYSQGDKDLSVFDILLVAMGSELRFATGGEVFIVTNDKRIKEVCEHHRKDPLRQRRLKKGTGGLDWPEPGRWRAPEVLYIKGTEIDRIQEIMNSASRLSEHRL